VVAVV